MPLRVIPVLDVIGGRAVAAFAGDRRRYRPLQGTAEGADPLAWAMRFRCLLEDAGATMPMALYVADLDAIEGRTPRHAMLDELADRGLALWVDAGIRGRGDLPSIFDHGATVAVLGLETIKGPETLAELIDLAGPDRLALSLDLRDGRPLVDTRPRWGTADPIRIARQGVDLGIHRLIVLDLARVGTGRGLGTEDLLEAIQSSGPRDLELIAGGGIDGPIGLDRASRMGIDGVLIGSALRDGRIGPIELRRAWEAGSSRGPSRRAAGDKAPAAPADEPPARPAEGS